MLEEPKSCISFNCPFNSKWLPALLITEYNGTYDLLPELTASSHLISFYFVWLHKISPIKVRLRYRVLPTFKIYAKSDTY